jgi:streptogramin lyase
MPKSLRFAGVIALASLFAPPLPAQTENPTTVAAGSSYGTENAGIVSGVRIDVRPDGSVWFLIPARDRIAVLTGEEMKQWQIRNDNQLGANPVDFEVDGDVVWFLCNGESQIDAGHSILGRLDTVTGQIREWEIPGARPAGFYRAADGKVWIPQTDRRLQSVDLTTLEVVDYRSGSPEGGGTQTIAYSDIVAGPDGALWMTDFGNNRVVRFEPGASTETSWTFFDPALGLLNPSQIQFDGEGRLWISQFSGARMDRFDPATGELVSFFGFAGPIHFDLFGGRVYVSEAVGANGQIAVLEPLLGVSGTDTIEPETLDVRPLVNARRATTRDYTVTPTIFASQPEAIPGEDLAVTAGLAGILRTEIPWTNAYGIDVVGGEVWVGSAGQLARVVLQTIGAESDLIAPVATQLAGEADAEGRVDIMLHNSGDEAISGDALYLFSPGFFAARNTFNLAPGTTALLSDAFGDVGSSTIPISGPVRLRVTSGPADKLVATVRTARAREDGGSFGYATPAFSAADSLGSGASRTLFTGARESESSVFGFYTPSGTEAVFTLVAPDGTVRGTLPISLAANIAEEFGPAASAFGVSEEPGDAIRVSVVSGTLLPYVRIVDEGTGDSALSLPAPATGDALFPNAGTAIGLFETSFVSDLFLSNPDSGSAAAVTLEYRPLDPLEPRQVATLSLPPGASSVVTDVLPTLFGVAVGQGALLVTSDPPVASSLRVASRKPEGDFANMTLPIEEDEAVPAGGSAFAFGVQTATRRTNLLLFNRGLAGTAQISGVNGNGDEIGRLTVVVGSDQPVRLDSVMAVLGLEEERNGRLVVEASDGVLLYGWVAEVDGPTGDVEISPLRQ